MAVALMKVLSSNRKGISDAGVYLLLFVKSLQDELGSKYHLEIKNHLKIIRHGECEFLMHEPNSNWDDLGLKHHYEYRIRIKVIENDQILIAIDDNNFTEVICEQAEQRLSEIKSFIISHTDTFIEDFKKSKGAPNTVKVASEETLERWNTELP